jgi:hypothetical protein
MKIFHQPGPCFVCCLFYWVDFVSACAKHCHPFNFFGFFTGLAGLVALLMLQKYAADAENAGLIKL